MLRYNQHFKALLFSVWVWNNQYLGFISRIEQKGMTFDHDFYYLFPFSSSLFFSKEREKGKIITKVVVKSHVFLLDLFQVWFIKIQTGLIIEKLFVRNFKLVLIKSQRNWNWSNSFCAIRGNIKYLAMYCRYINIFFSTI